MASTLVRRWWLAFAAVLAVTAAVVVVCLTTRVKPPQPVGPSPAYRIRKSRVLEGIHRTGAVTDSDLDWIVTVCGPQSNLDPGFQAVLIAALSETRTITPRQHETMFRLAEQAAKYNGPYEPSLAKRLAAAPLLGNLRDPRGIPILKSLAHDREEGPRVQAQRALERLGVAP